MANRARASTPEAATAERALSTPPAPAGNRRAPLKRVTPLRAGVSRLARTKIAPTSTARKRLNARRARTEQALGRVGTTGFCARHGGYGPVNGHERLARAQGGDPSRPDCLLCPACNQWCEDNPADAALDGWKVSRKYDRDPVLVGNEARQVDGSVFVFGTTVTERLAS